jgi:putative transposase
MAVPKRHASIAGTYFVTSRTWESRAVFKIQKPCEIFIEAILYYRDRGTYKLHGFVLMPDHFHLLVTPGQEVALERAVQFVKGGSARRIGLELNSKLPIWQRGFSDHRIRDVQDYLVHTNYLEQNPVKRRLVETAFEYPVVVGEWCLRDGRRTSGVKTPELDGRFGTAEAVP